MFYGGSSSFIRLFSEFSGFMVRFKRIELGFP